MKTEVERSTSQLVVIKKEELLKNLKREDNLGDSDHEMERNDNEYSKRHAWITHGLFKILKLEKKHYKKCELSHITMDK